MKKILQSLCLIILFSVIYYGCRKDSNKNEQLFTPYSDVINPPDSFYYYIPLPYNAILKGKIQFKENAVWRITKTLGIGANTSLSRTDSTSIFSIAQNDTVALQGNILYTLTASNANSQDGVKIYFLFTKVKSLDYQSFSPKY